MGGGGKRLILKLLFKYLFYSCNKIIVHSSEEVRYLSKHYNEPAEKFEFIPYFFYESDGDNVGYKQLPPEPLFCSAGNNRDFDTFAQALLQTQSRGRMVGVAKEPLPASDSFELYPKVSRKEYDRLIKESDVIVISLYRDRFQRSLGQILLMKAFYLKKPCIVAHNPYITDYCDDQSAVFYEPENTESLVAAINKIKTMSSGKIKKMTDNAYSSLEDKTRTNYLKHIEKLLNSI